MHLLALRVLQSVDLGQQGGQQLGRGTAASALPTPAAGHSVQLIDEDDGGCGAPGGGEGCT